MDNYDDFTIHLPSNTRFIEANTASKYVVKLALSPNLSGEWECGLKEIHYPHTWHNITDFYDKQFLRMQVIIKEARGTAYEDVYLQGGYYKNNSDLVKEIQKKIRGVIYQDPELEASIKVSYDEFSRKINFEIPHRLEIGINPQLAAVLGFDNQPKTWVSLRKKHEKPKFPMAINLVDALYVYSDVVQTSLVGDAMVPLLRIVPVVGEYGKMSHIEYIKPVYYPLAKLNFSTVEIFITDSAGRKIDFPYGKTTIMLHFRRRKKRTTSGKL